MGEQNGRWKKLSGGGRYRSVWDDEGNFLRSEAQWPGLGMPEREPPRLVDSAGSAKARERAVVKTPRPTRLAGGCKLYRFPGASRSGRPPAAP